MTTKTANPQPRRLVAIDCETNGLFGNVRILSLAVVELRNFIAYDSKLWMMNPGNVPMDPSALAVNGLTPEMLTDAKRFSDHLDEIRLWLKAPRGSKMTLVGHKVAFDAKQLAGEFARMGEKLPRFDLLDTARLAEAAGVYPANQSLAALLDALGVPNTAPHTALGDALATAQAAIALMKRLPGGRDDDELGSVLDSLVTSYRAGSEKPLARSKPTAPLSKAHAAAHLIDLSDGRRRRGALDTCLFESCEFLSQRMEDGIVEPAHAPQVIDWALGYLEDYELSQAMVGQLLCGLGRALRRSEDPDLLLRIYRERLVPLLAELEPCGRTRAKRCLTCRDRTGACDLMVVLRSCVDGFLDSNYSAFARPVPERVDQFLPGYDPRVLRKRGRPVEGFYGEIRRNGHLDAAGYGAYRVADVRRTQGGRAWAHAVLNKAWRDGCRNPQMTEMLASMVVVDGLVDGVEPTDPKAPVAAALSYIVECRTTYSSQHGQIFDRLAKRERRLAALMDAPERPQRDPAKAVNRRQPHATLLAEPLANTAVPVKKASPKRSSSKAKPRSTRTKQGAR